jgi:hypothetical protein
LKKLKDEVKRINKLKGDEAVPKKVKDDAEALADR